MAGDWIKMQGNLWTNPKVVQIMSATKADKCRVIGALFRVWCLFDEHTEDGKLLGYTKFILDDELRIDDFSSAMESVGWLIQLDDGGLQVPDFNDHMSKSAKKRSQDTKRKRDGRKMSASEADKNRTREEKRREENIKDKHTPTAKFNFKSSVVNLGVDKSVVSDWLRVRSKKGSSNTETAFKSLAGQIEKSKLSAQEVITMCAENSWAGFRADWIDGAKRDASSDCKSMSDSQLLAEYENRGWDSKGKSVWQMRERLEGEA